MDQNTVTDVCLNPRPQGILRIIAFFLRMLADRIDGLSSASFEIQCTERLDDTDYEMAIKAATNTLAESLQQRAAMRYAMRSGAMAIQPSHLVH